MCPLGVSIRLMSRANAVLYTRSSGLDLMTQTTTPGRTKRTARDLYNWWTRIGRVFLEASLLSTRNQGPHASVICRHLPQRPVHGNVDKLESVTVLPARIIVFSTTGNRPRICQAGRIKSRKWRQSRKPKTV
jgi:hypothetical protein